MSRPRSASHPRDPYVVSDKTCSGCVYYAPLYASVPRSTRCCNYTYLTGKVRPEGETCAECSVKAKGEQKKTRVQINIDHSDEGIRQYRERMGIAPKRSPSHSGCTIDPDDLDFLRDLLFAQDPFAEPEGE